MWWWNGGYGPGFFGFGPLFMIVIIGAIIAVLYFLMRGADGDRSDRSRATEILKERFARGEITQAQFEEQRRLLEA